MTGIKKYWLRGDLAFSRNFCFGNLQEEPSAEPTQRDQNRKMQAVLVDSWRPSNFGQANESPASTRRTHSDTGHTHPGHLQHLSLTYSPDNHTSNGKLNDLSEHGRVTQLTRRSRLESDPIDRGYLPSDDLQGKVESLENSLDQIYRKMKTELGDVRESIRKINRYSAGSSYSMSPSPSTKNNNMYPCRYPRTTDHVDVWQNREENNNPAENSFKSRSVADFVKNASFWTNLAKDKTICWRKTPNLITFVDDIPRLCSP